MICIICRQAEFINGYTSVTFEREEFHLMVNHVPAQVCPNCAEAVVDEETTMRLLNLAEDSLAQGMREGVLDFGEVT